MKAGVSCKYAYKPFYAPETVGYFMEEDYEGQNEDIPCGSQLLVVISKSSKINSYNESLMTTRVRCRQK